MKLKPTYFCVCDPNICNICTYFALFIFDIAYLCLLPFCCDELIRGWLILSSSENQLLSLLIVFLCCRFVFSFINGSCYFYFFLLISFSYSNFLRYILRLIIFSLFSLIKAFRCVNIPLVLFIYNIYIFQACKVFLIIFLVLIFSLNTPRSENMLCIV